jgi:hypothetical protein
VQEAGRVRPGRAAGWEQALQNVRGQHDRPLRTALGHFGRAFSERAGNWPVQFVDLMAELEGDPLYADLSSCEELPDPSRRDAHVERQRELFRSVNHSMPVRSR